MDMDIVQSLSLDQRLSNAVDRAVMKNARALCDNAPVVNIPLCMNKPKSITLIVPYYENPNFLQQQILNWQGGYPDEVSKQLSIILVDDGSPFRPAEKELRIYWLAGSLIRLRHFRLEVDVRWNWLAARNIGAKYAETEWIMLTDIDHVLTTDVLRTLIYGEHDPSIIYRFSRREHTGEHIHPHPNSWFMTKKMYWKVGGYDEALSGYYGTDGEYRRRCAVTAPIRIMVDELVRHERLGDSSTIRYLRKQPEDARGKQLIRERKPDWKPKVLSFPYHEVLL